MHLYSTLLILLVTLATSYAQDEIERSTREIIKEHMQAYIEASSTFDTMVLRKLNRQYDNSPFALRAVNLHKIKLSKVGYVGIAIAATMLFQYKDNKPEVYVLHIEKAVDSPSRWTITKFFPVEEDRGFFY
uniref:Cystatin n=1 Tax=Caenorhabditis japonica TaxID=281687 RepID=A0A2Q4SEH2_CAEJA